jgi:hypothetical protein
MFEWLVGCKALAVHRRHPHSIFLSSQGYISARLAFPRRDTTGCSTQTGSPAPKPSKQCKAFSRCFPSSLSQSGRSVDMPPGTDEGGGMEGLIDAVATEHVQTIHTNQALTKISTCDHLNYCSLFDTASCIYLAAQLFRGIVTGSTPIRQTSKRENAWLPCQWPGRRPDSHGYIRR